MLEQKSMETYWRHHVYVYIYIEREREWERECVCVSERERESVCVWEREREREREKLIDWVSRYVNPSRVILCLEFRELRS